MRDVEVVSKHAGLARLSFSVWAVLIYLFLFAPIAVLVAFSFNANKYGTFPFTGWTLDWYREVFGDYQIKDALYTSIKIALEVTLISTVVGTAAAFPLVRSNLPFRSGIRIGMTLPIMIPGLLIGVSLLILMTSVFHFQLSPQTAVIGQAVYTTPFVVLLVIRISRLTPINRPGIMIGNVIPIRIPLRNGRFERTSGNAAAVPTTVEITVTSRATLSEV